MTSSRTQTREFDYEEDLTLSLCETFFFSFQFHIFSQKNEEQEI